MQISRALACLLSEEKEVARLLACYSCESR